MGSMPLRVIGFRSIELLPANYPANLAQLDQYWSTQGQTDLAESGWIRQHYLSTIGVFRWSPNGRLLAFVGGMDGPSTDLYVLDTTSWDLRRLSDGPMNTLLDDWSPDSRYILNSGSLGEGCGGGSFNNYYFSPEDGSAPM